MKQHVIIQENDKIIYEGRISDIPIKEASIIEKSIELFDDDDPCIIHQSYVIKEYVDVILRIFKKEASTSFLAKDYRNELQFLNIESLDHITISLKE